LKRAGWVGESNRGPNQEISTKKGGGLEFKKGEKRGKKDLEWSYTFTGQTGAENRDEPGVNPRWAEMI